MRVLMSEYLEHQSSGSGLPKVQLVDFIPPYVMISHSRCSSVNTALDRLEPNNVAAIEAIADNQLLVFGYSIA